MIRILTITILICFLNQNAFAKPRFSKRAVTSWFEPSSCAANTDCNTEFEKSQPSLSEGDYSSTGAVSIILNSIFPTLKIFSQKVFLFDQTKNSNFRVNTGNVNKELTVKMTQKLTKNTSLEFHRDVCHIKLQCPI